MLHQLCDTFPTLSADQEEGAYLSGVDCLQPFEVTRTSPIFPSITIHGLELNRAASIPPGTPYCAGWMQGVGVPCILTQGFGELWDPVEGETVGSWQHEVS